MAQLYDSDLIRTAARSARQLAYELESGTAKPAQRAINASEPLRGLAAEAMRQSLEEMNAALGRLCGGIDEISRDLDRYAAVVEEVSQNLASEMQ